MDGKKWGLLPSLLLAGMAFLVGRASILGSLFPFGPALVAAAAGLGLSRPGLLLAAGVTVAGTLTAGSPLAAVQTVLTLVLFDLFWRLASDTRARQAPMLALLAAGLAGLAQHLLVPGQTADDWFRLVTGSLLTGLLAYAYGLGLGLLPPPPRARVVTMTQVLAAGLLLLTAISGLGYGPLPSFSLRNTMGAYWVMLLAHLGGAPLGAALGAAFGLVAGLGAGIVPGTVGLYAFAGLTGGVGRELGRWGTALTFLVGHLLLAQTATPVPGSLTGAEALIAAVLLVATPAGWLSMLGAVLSGASPVLGDAASPAAQAGSEAARRLHELAQVFGELGQAFAQVAAISAPPAAGDPNLAALFAGVSERACGGCPLHRTCWHDDVFPTYTSLRSLWGQVERDGPAPPDALGGPLRRRCLRPAEVVGTVNYLHDLLRIDRFWEQRVAEARLLVAAQLRGVGQIMERMADEVRTNPTLPVRAAGWDRGPARFAYRAGVSRRHKTGGSVSGDSYLIRPLGDGRLLVALSDGMGAGVPAALESRATLTLLERLMDTGFDAALSIQTINSILLLRSAEEKFATMDLAVFDLWQGECELTKIGAAPSYIKSALGVREWRAPSVPAGILQQIDVESARWQFASGDILVMMSDGLLAARGGHDTAWIEAFLAASPDCAPQVLAESLLTHALGGQPEVADDTTVLVLQLTEHGLLPDPA